MPELRLSSGSLDLDRGLLRAADGIERPLTALELTLLRYLCERPNQDVSRDELLREVWRGEGEGRVVDFAIRRLRQKIGEPKHPRHIITAHGLGYRFVPLAEVAIRNAPASSSAIPLARGDLFLAERRFVRDGESVALSHIEFKLLSVLAQSLGQPVPRERLASSVWGRGQHGHTLDVTIARLRGKLERSPESPEVLVTVRGEGIMLVGLSRAGRGHLPMPESSFIERPERALTLHLLEQQPLVTLLGTAGLGKTRLALEVGAAWRQSGREVWFCDLTRTGRLERMVSAISALLTGESQSDGLRLGRVFAACPRGTLVVLDNLEHLLDCAWLVASWMGDAPHVRFLVTSRAPLGLDSEHVFPLSPLGGSEAVSLFFERTLEEQLDIDKVATLTERLDRLPLAIELAAALTERMSVGEILDRLGERLDLLVLRPEGATSQHSTLRGAIEWSWHLLSRGQQEVLACCSVFCGEFSAKDAAAIVGRESDDEIAWLERRSLLQRSGSGYRLLMSIRDFARERLLLSGALRQATERHAEHFVALSERWVGDLYGPWTREALALLSAARDDLLAALESTERPDRRGRLCRILSARGFIGEHRSLAACLSRALEAGVSAEEEPYVWMAMAMCSRRDGHLDRARSEMARAAALASPEDAPLQVRLALSCARNALIALEPHRAADDLERARMHLSGLPPSLDRLRLRAEEAALRALATEKVAPEAWEESIREGLLLASEVGDVSLIGQMHRMNGRRHKLAGRFDEALDHFKRALDVARAAERRDEEQHALFSMAHIEHQCGDFPEASAHLDEYDAISRAMGHADRGEVAIMRAYMAFERGEHTLALSLEENLHPTLSALLGLLRFDVLLACGDPSSALAQLARNDAPLRRAVGLASLGRFEEAHRCLNACGQGVWWERRTHALVSALVGLLEARGTEARREAERAARALLAGGEIVERGGLRIELPYDARMARRWLERALAPTGRS